MPQLVQSDKHFGFFAWCARFEFFRALEWRLRGTAMTNYSLTNVANTLPYQAIKHKYFYRVQNREEREESEEAAKIFGLVLRWLKIDNTK